MSATRTISLPEELCLRAEGKFSARFGSIEDLLTSLLTELLRDDAPMDEREQQIVEERLKGLGYV
jgi:hypothetical protein